MQTLVNDIGSWLWRLVPANPILVRVVHAGGRRVQHLWIRIGYLAVLMAAVSIGVVVAQSGGSSSLTALAKSATQVFKVVSSLQLLMVCILAPIFTAAAITQEKNSQTFNILLATPLTNGQIVLGSLLSRLYFVFVLLLAGIPLFCIMMVYGGVTGDKILLSIALAGCTAVLTGSLAISISVIKVGTGRTIFSFYLAIALYLAAVYALSSWSFLIPAEAAPAPGATERMSWLAPFHPFLSLWVVLGRTPAPDLGAVAHYGWPFKYWLAYPAYSYITMTLVSSVLLIVGSLAFVRRSAQEGEPTLFNRVFSRGKNAEAGRERTRKPRHVGKNPVAWREATTGAAGGGALMRYSVLALGFLVGLVVLVFYGTNKITAQEARQWLFGIVGVELGITLFIATATAATSMTREKESNTLALLLSTPITSAQIISGKIMGLIFFALPMLAAPFLTILLFVVFDLFKGNMASAPGPVVHWEALITIPLMMLAFTAAACMIGLRSSINAKRTLTAVFTSGAILTVSVGVLSACAMSVISSSEPLASALMPLSPYYGIWVAIDPESALELGSGGPLVVNATTLSQCRTIAFIASIVSAALYAAVVWGVHGSMVRNFDMIIRKQTA